MTEFKRSDYSEKLRDPRWQKKRLEIMNRDVFTCQRCWDGERTLNVHHCYYVNGNDPWDYPDISLITLCEGCHHEETEDLWNAQREAMNAFGRRGFMAHDFLRIMDSLYGGNSKINIDELCLLLERKDNG